MSVLIFAILAIWKSIVTKSSKVAYSNANEFTNEEKNYG